ncbi:MAG TPA: NUDIX hydrolase [Nocardioides bacterium]|uniref:NUDIX domain-containing protein n=1 Tax=uncultured Nocardioides sp. TaxID=198441 RepID=UPI000EDD6953|nr:NUDIX hydrolase [uncultured Nocardioides sp.]HCB03672.1 NUDIX hydrolase [Nocardioides sp.]HRD63433.1 NUDIX hydrolase [Nocardioides sp.]HRK47509.1 NUDIX hydrolase [Nocardioides sp.]
MTWATCTLGHAHWGRRGAAGLLLAESGRVLLQLRAKWAHQGGTWSIPGGARERGESAVDAALREAAEEMSIRGREVEVRSSYVATCGGWSYETVLAVPSGPVHLAHLSESDAHLWADVDDVGRLSLHPAFRRAWEAPDGTLQDFVTRA